MTAAIVILIALLFVHYGPLLDTHSEQDACTFGPVSNARYRELLAEAKRQPTTVWPSYVWNTKKFNTLLNERIDELSSGMTSVYERLAVMHAVARAFGGDYRRTGFGIADPYAKATESSGVMVFEYQLDLNRHIFFSPIQRYLLLYGQLVLKNGASATQDKSRANLGDIEFYARYPIVGFDGGRRIPRSHSGEACPVLPDAALAGRLSRTER